jgi:hypothetical protein
MLVRLGGLIAVIVSVLGLAGVWDTSLSVDLAVGIGGLGAMISPLTEEHLRR